jgi:TolB-like protein
VALENTGYTSLMKITRMQRAAGTQAQLAAMKPPVPLWKKLATVAAGAVVLAGAGYGAYKAFANPAPVSNAALKAEMSRLAVMYLVPDGGGDLPALADGITDGVIARLRQVNALTVVSPDGVAQYRGRAVEDSTIPTALRVGAVVTGELRREGDQLVVVARLLDKSGEQLGSSVTVRQPASAAVTLRDSVAERLANELRRLIGDEVQLVAGRGSASSTQAWTLLQRGMRARREADSLARAEQLDAALARLDAADVQFREAAALDARWPAPQAARAGTALMRVEFIRDRRSSAPWVDSAEAAANAALALDPQDAEARAARGRARAARVLNELVTGRDADDMYALAAADLERAGFLKTLPGQAPTHRADPMETNFAMREREPTPTAAG